MSVYRQHLPSPDGDRWNVIHVHVFYHFMFLYQVPAAWLLLCSPNGVAPPAEIFLHIRACVWPGLWWVTWDLPSQSNIWCTCVRKIPWGIPPAPHPYYLLLQAVTLSWGFLWSWLSWVIKSLFDSAQKGQIFDMAVSCKKRGELSTWRPIHIGFISSLQRANKLPTSDDSATDKI